MRGEGGGREWALVTGASAGIGAEIARELARRGRNLALTARRRSRLESLAAELREEAGVEVEVIPADLRGDGGVEELVAALEGRGIEVGILVNAAGIGSHGPFVDTDPDVVRDTIALNVGAVTGLTRLLLPGMVRRGRGRILNVASIAAFQPGPRMAVYYATKAYVLSFSEALAEELRGSGVTVTTLCPGPTRSEFHARAGIRADRLAGRLFLAEPRRVAEYGVRALVRGKGIALPGVGLRAYLLALRVLPRSWVPRLVRRLQDLRG